MQAAGAVRPAGHENRGLRGYPMPDAIYPLILYSDDPVPIVPVFDNRLALLKVF